MNDWEKGPPALTWLAACLGPELVRDHNQGRPTQSCRPSKLRGECAAEAKEIQRDATTAIEWPLPSGLVIPLWKYAQRKNTF